MASEPCGTCDGDGKIYDWNTKKGDPCPDCDGRGFTFVGKANMAAYRVKHDTGLCVVTLLYLIAGAAEVVYAATELASMVTGST